MKLMVGAVCDRLMNLLAHTTRCAGHRTPLVCAGLQTAHRHQSKHHSVAAPRPGAAHSTSSSLVSFKALCVLPARLAALPRCHQRLEHRSCFPGELLMTTTHYVRHTWLKPLPQCAGALLPSYRHACAQQAPAMRVEKLGLGGYAVAHSVDVSTMLKHVNGFLLVNAHTVAWL